jgi:hypothetical protein
LKVKSLRCEQCGTEVTGLYELPLLARLKPEEQDFIVRFMKCSGSLKDMAKQFGLSYPTVRNMLDDLIERMVKEEKKKDMHHKMGDNHKH